MLHALTPSAFNPITAAHYENLGLKPNPLVIAMDGYLADKIRENSTPPVASARKFRGLDLLSEYRDRAKALPASSSVLLDIFKTPVASALWQGFRHGWVKRPHRLSEEASFLSGIAYDRNRDAVSYNQTSAFRVGAYADVGNIASHSAVFKSDALSLAYGRVGEDRLRVEGKLGKKGVVRVTERIDLEKAGLKPDDEFTVVLNGFSLRCLNYAGGFNTRGYGVRVIPLGVRDGFYEFDVEFRIHPEHAPDRPQPDDFYVGPPSSDGDYQMLSLLGHAAAYLRWAFAPLGKLTGWWSAKPKQDLSTYAYAAHVDYAVIGADPTKAKITAAGTLPTNIYSQTADLGLFKRRIKPVPLETMKASLAGQPGFENAVVAIQGFDWHLEDWDPTKKDGRYIRDLEIRMGNTGYDPVSGRMDFSTLMKFSNESRFPKGFDARYAMWNSLIQFGETEGARPAVLEHKGRLGENARLNWTNSYPWPD